MAERESSTLWRIASSTTVEFLAFSVVLFFALSASKVDILSVLGFDSLLGPKGAFASERDILTRIIANILGGFTLAALAIGLRQRTRRVAEAAIDAVTVSTAKGEGNSNSSRNEVQPPQQGAILSLNKRIATLSLRATTIYWTMILSLVTGVFLIIFAGYLSSFDTNFSNLSSKIESDRLDALQTFGRYFQQRQSPSATFSAADNNAFDYARDRVKAIDETYAELLKAMIHQTSERGENKPVWNWPSTILRIGVIGLLVFLTQILISLYRYNSRLIAFYGSRRDALLLCSDDLAKINGLSELMYPAALDFGREPRHPFQELSELLRRNPPKPDESKPATKTPRQSDRNKKDKEENQAE